MINKLFFIVLLIFPSTINAEPTTTNVVPDVPPKIIFNESLECHSLVIQRSDRDVMIYQAQLNQLITFKLQEAAILAADLIAIDRLQSELTGDSERAKNLSRAYAENIAYIKELLNKTKEYEAREKTLTEQRDELQTKVLENGCNPSETALTADRVTSVCAAADSLDPVQDTVACKSYRYIMRENEKQEKQKEKGRDKSRPEYSI